MDPLQRFGELLSKVRATPGVLEPTGMTLATVGPDGRPSARIVLLKGVDERGLVFYTNSRSRKGREVTAHSDVALTFWWPQLEMQVRFEGKALKVAESESDAYFASRARVSQIGAWASQQSEELRSREELEERFATLEKQYEGKEVPRPPHWYGFRVAPLYVEFWRSRPGRLHERDVYTRAAPGEPWTMKLLNP
jgi:pyridoxamine 5'-phosphate oxidase